MFTGLAKTARFCFSLSVCDAKFFLKCSFVRNLAPAEISDHSPVTTTPGFSRLVCGVIYMDLVVLHDLCLADGSEDGHTSGSCKWQCMVRPLHINKKMLYGRSFGNA